MTSHRVLRSYIFFFFFLLKFFCFKDFYKTAQLLGFMAFGIYEFVPVQSERGMVYQLLTL